MHKTQAQTHTGSFPCGSQVVPLLYIHREIDKNNVLGSQGFIKIVVILSQPMNLLFNPHSLKDLQNV